MDKSKIFIVDDSLVKRESIKRAIISTYDVVIASSGKEALEMLEVESPDLIILDVEMPEMDGYQVIQEIQCIEALAEIPVVFLAARSDPAAELYGLSLGAMDYISFPFSPPLLLKRIELHLSLVRQKLEMAKINDNLAKLVEERTAELKESNDKLKTALDVAEIANRAKSVFIANMSHETKTPLNSIVGFSELAQHEEISDKVRGYFDNISESASWLLNITNDILDISVFELGKIVLNRVPFDFSEIFDFCQFKFNPSAKKKGIIILWDMASVARKKVIGDSARLRQVLVNLLSNAVKFTQAGTVQFSAIIKNEDSKAITIVFKVEDAGIGMSQEQMTRIFEPFAQGDDSITRKYGGAGLGLPIVKNIIELMGSKLEVESTVDAGSTFSFELTFDLAEDESNQIAVANVLQKPHFNGEVLVCEDNRMNQDVICAHLSTVGLKFVVANNGKEGVNFVAERIRNGEKLFDLIFMDIRMPIMDGLKAVIKIHELDVKTPIVALTANVMSSDLELYRLSGMSGAIGKPFTTQELWDCLATHLNVEGYTAIDHDKQLEEDDKLKKMLKLNFAKDFKNVYRDITSSVNNGDIKTAYRLSHTIKGIAGQIDETALQAAAAAVEGRLKNEEYKLDSQQLAVFETELSAALEKFAPLLVEDQAKVAVKITDVNRVQEILKKLEPLLVSKNPDCEEMLDDIRAIPGTEALVSQMEKFKFKMAINELAFVKKEWGMYSES